MILHYINKCCLNKSCSSEAIRWKEMLCLIKCKTRAKEKTQFDSFFSYVWIGCVLCGNRLGKCFVLPKTKVSTSVGQDNCRGWKVSLYPSSLVRMLRKYLTEPHSVRAVKWGCWGGWEGVRHRVLAQQLILVQGASLEGPDNVTESHKELRNAGAELLTQICKSH